MPSFINLADTPLTQPIQDAIRPKEEILGSADEDLVHLKNREPAALDQIFG
jgi:hypothetical protein